MAQRRGSSMPASGMANPFWSNRAKDEWVLQAVRPADLPAPEDEETQKQLEQETEMPVMDSEKNTRGRSRSRWPSPVRAQGVFRTPQSWETGKGVGSVGLRTSGAMPTVEEAQRRMSQQTQGPEPGSDHPGDSLQRALEVELMTQLHEENMKLKQMLSKVQQSKGTGTTSTSEWSEVSGGGGDKIAPPLEQSSGWKDRIMHVHTEWNKGAIESTSTG